MSRRRIIVYALCLTAFLAHASFSVQARAVQASWANVPPVPDRNGAAMLALGDRQLAYRITGIMLQNLGDTGGRSAPLHEYDYEALGRWFALADGLDSRSNFVPLLAAYYYGATQDAEQLGPVIDYLAMVGRRTEENKWRWLAQAVYLARFRQEDFDKAKNLAAELAAMWKPGMPGWVRQMPAFVALQSGDKQAAYDIMVTILKEEADAMHPNEVNFMVGYICERLLDEQEAAVHPLCNPIPEQAPKNPPPLAGGQGGEYRGKEGLSKRQHSPPDPPASGGE